MLQLGAQKSVKTPSFAFISLAFFLYVISLMQLTMVYCLTRKIASICSPTLFSHFLGKATEHFKTKGVKISLDKVFQIHVFIICSI